jgi:hypothetical protein
MLVLQSQESVEVFINTGGGISIKQPDPGHDSGASIIAISVHDVEKLVKALRKVAKGEDN